MKVTSGRFVLRERLISKLREIGFSFKRQADRIDLYKRGIERAEVQRRDHVSEEYVYALLLRCKCSPEEIKRFLGQCSN